jgi:hypothetical protein
VGIAISTGFVPSARGLALENLTVQRASRSFWRSLAGRFFQADGTRPALMAAFPEIVQPPKAIINIEETAISSSRQIL